MKLVLVVVVVGMFLPRSAGAAATIWSTNGRATPVAAGEGKLVFSVYSPARKRYRLVMAETTTTSPKVTTAAGVPSSPAAFDVSIGRLHGRAVALYSRCRDHTSKCDLYSYDFARNREAKLREASSPYFDEAWPVLSPDGRRIAFARRATTRAPNPFRQDPKTVKLRCDLTYVRDLAGRRPSRRLDRTTCGAIEGLAFNGRQVATIIEDRPGDGAAINPYLNQGSILVLAPAGGGKGKVLATAVSGEGGWSPFQAIAFRRGSLIAAQNGNRFHIKSGFLELPLDADAAPKRTPNPNLIGPFALDGDTTYAIVGLPATDGYGPDAGGVCGAGSESILSPAGTPEEQIEFGQAPCRLERGTGLPTS